MAVLVKVREDVPLTKPTVSRGFQFEEMWTKHDGYEDMIKETWERRNMGVTDIKGLWRQFQEVSSDIKRWSFETFGSVKASCSVRIGQG
jgi:hypothetical protein